MNLPAAHIERIKDLGYTEPEARFLYIVAVFSGYFTLGHFRLFTQSSFGKRSSSFAQKLLKNGHATVRDYMQRGLTFHLFSRTIYGAIEKDNLRNRKRHSFDFIRTRLVLLDFVLANQELAYLETEQDKVDFFCKKLGVSKDFLPAKLYQGASAGPPAVRYFVDKFPLFVAHPVPGVPPVVTFSYVDAGLEGPSSFRSHLAAYQGLFRQLDSFQFVYIATKSAYFGAAEQRFRSLVQGAREADPSSEVLWYFGIRRKWENDEYIVPVTRDLEYLNEGRRRFCGERFEMFYQEWLSGEIEEGKLRAELSEMKPHRAVSFNTFLVEPHECSLAADPRGGDSDVGEVRDACRHGSRHSDSDAKLLRD